MGQAKRRGTIEQRQATAKLKKKNLSASEKRAATIAAAVELTETVLRKTGLKLG